MTIRIPLTQGKVALVDDQDGDLARYKWCYWTGGGGYGYAMRYERNRDKQDPKAKRKVIQLHRVILQRMYPELNGDFLSDHISGDALDNHRRNLRPCTPQQNTWNSRAKQRQGKRSQYKGVYLRRRKYTGVYRKPKWKPWAARVRINGETVRLGVFETEVEAALAYNTAAVEHFGEFAWLNRLPNEFTDLGVAILDAEDMPPVVRQMLAEVERIWLGRGAPVKEAAP